MLTSLFLFAQELVPDEAKKGPAEIPFYQNPIMLLPVMMILFYFVVIRPQQRKQRAEAENLMSSLKKNDEVLTASGIIGIVAHIKEGGDEVTLKIDDNARIRVLRSSIVRIMKKDDPASTASGNTNIKPV